MRLLRSACGFLLIFASTKAYALPPDTSGLLAFLMLYLSIFTGVGMAIIWLIVRIAIGYFHPLSTAKNRWGFAIAIIIGSVFLIYLITKMAPNTTLAASAISPLTAISLCLTLSTLIAVLLVKIGSITSSILRRIILFLRKKRS